MGTNYVESGIPSETLIQSLHSGGGALLVLLLGLGAALVARYAVTWGLEHGGFAALCDRSGFTEFLRKGEVSYSPARLIGVCAYWILALASLLWALDLVGIGIAAALSGKVKSALPSLLSAVGVFIVGYSLVTFLANLIRTIAMNAMPAYAGLLAKALKWIGVTFVLVMSVEQLGFGTRIIVAAVQIVLGAVALGLALAFGLGCKDLAKDAMVRFLHHLKERTGGGNPDMEG